MRAHLLALWPAATQRPAVGTMLAVMGWGYTDQEQTKPVSLQQVGGCQGVQRWRSCSDPAHLR